MKVCITCGRENPPEAIFCNGCGVGLMTVTAPREQRKTVTVLFCDVTGSTAMGERLDPESLRQVMRRYFDAARRVIEHHGGTVEKFIGDAVMAVFGVPVLHEDDALRAVRAAVGLRDALTALNGELERDYATTVILRTGVNTGQVVTGTEERLATGDAVNLAARLEQAAAPGEIVIGPETWRLVRGAVTAEALEPLDLKGKSLPVSAYRLLEVSSDPPGLARSVGPRLVGRRTQLRMVTQAFINVTDGRSCSLFTVFGAAGVGKSRLAAEFLASVDATVVSGTCLSYGEGITYSPVISAVKQLLEAGRESGAQMLMARDDKAAAAIKVLLGDTGPPTSPAEIAWAVRKLFESAAETKPLIVVFDDVHWGESVLFDLIEHVCDFSRDASILILCLSRPELLDRRPTWSGGKLNATTVLLEPLKAGETETLIDDLLPADASLDPKLRERVRKAAGGNPLFVEEMLAMLRESTSDDLAVPPTIQALLAARLDQLPPEERSVLEHGSIEGQSFHLGAVQVMTAGDEDVPRRVMTLVRKDLLRPDRAVFAGEDAFRFRHLLIRDAAYEALSKGRRAELHECFAGWLQQRPQDLVELDEIAGYHLERSFRYRSELGTVDEAARGAAAVAAKHLDAAGRRALDRGDPVAAVNLLERAHSLLPAHELNLTLEESLIQGLGMCGRLDDALSRAGQLRTLCSAAHDRVGELRARLIGAVWGTMVDPAAHDEELRRLVEEARPVLERDGDHAAMASLEYAAGHLEHYRCHFGAAFASLMRSKEHAQHAGELWFERDRRAVAAAAVAFGPTPVDEALRWLEREQAESGLFQPILDVRRAFLMACLGEFDQARALFAATIAQASERGQRALVAMSMQEAWSIEMLGGDVLAAERAARVGCEQLEKVGERAWLSTQACQLGDALYALGRYDEAEEWAMRGLELGGSDDVLTQQLGNQVRSKVLARRGQFSAALGLGEQADILARTTDAPLQQGDAALVLAEVLHLAQDRTRARHELRRAVERYQWKGAVACAARARRLAATWPSAQIV